MIVKDFSQYRDIIQRWNSEPFLASGDAKVDQFIGEIGDGTMLAMQAEAEGRVQEALTLARTLTPLVDKFSDLVDRPDLLEAHLLTIQRLEALCPTH